jgi:hypothetical protein
MTVGNPATGRAGTRPRVVAPGDALLHPIAVASVVVLLLNDHVWKAAMPGAVTGELSDFAGLIFFPLMLIAAAEIAQDGVGRWQRPNRKLAIAACLLTAAGFALVKATAIGTTAWSVATGAMQWLPGAAADVFMGHGLPAPARTLVAMDVTDLIALPAVLVAFWIARSRFDEPER